MTETKQEPPQTDRETGVAFYGKYPANHRLRAEALAKEGKAADPDDIVSAELIADAGQRLAQEAKASPKPLASMTAANLRELAAAEGVPFETDDNKADLVTKIENHRATRAS